MRALDTPTNDVKNVISIDLHYSLITHIVIPSTWSEHDILSIVVYFC